MWRKGEPNDEVAYRGAFGRIIPVTVLTSHVATKESDQWKKQEGFREKESRGLSALQDSWPLGAMGTMGVTDESRLDLGIGNRKKAPKSRSRVISQGTRYLPHIERCAKIGVVKA